MNEFKVVMDTACTTPMLSIGCSVNVLESAAYRLTYSMFCIHIQIPTCPRWGVVGHNIDRCIIVHLL